MKVKFYKCLKCGQIVIKVKDTSFNLKCCEQYMEELKPYTEIEEGEEKHIPAYEFKDNSLIVTIGQNMHPSSNTHYIMWILVQTSMGYKIRYLKPGDCPCVTFPLSSDDKVEAIYSYCNLHSLWVRNIS